MAYPAYYVTLLNLINGKNVLDTTLPDSATEDEITMMTHAYETLRPLQNYTLQCFTHRLDMPLTDLYGVLTQSHERYDVLRRHGFVLHRKETLWVEALDKALPLLMAAAAMPWSKGGEWSPNELAPDAGTDEVSIHAILVACIQYGLLVLEVQELRI